MISLRKWSHPIAMRTIRIRFNASLTSTLVSRPVPDVGTLPIERQQMIRLAVRAWIAHLESPQNPVRLFALQ